MLRWLTERRRAHLLERPFPEAWLEILEANVAAYALLDDDERRRLRDLVQVFVAEKHWEGAGGSSSPTRSASPSPARAASSCSGAITTCSGAS